MSDFHPLRTSGSEGILAVMDKRGALIALVGLVLILALMFYNGMFMHGTSVRFPPKPDIRHLEPDRMRSLSVSRIGRLR
jgi:hypothetical protein